MIRARLLGLGYLLLAAALLLCKIWLINSDNLFQILTQHIKLASPVKRLLCSVASYVGMVGLGPDPTIYLLFLYLQAVM